MISGVLTRVRAWAATGLLVVAGCVNDYVRGDLVEETSTSSADMPQTTGPGTTSDAPQTTGGSGSGGSGESTSGSSSSSGQASDSADSEMTTSVGDGAGSDSDSGGGRTFELCGGPCDADAQCGGRSDLCVQLVRGAEGRCLRRCGRGCPDGYACVERTSVEGGSAEQCVPDGNMCP